MIDRATTTISWGLTVAFSCATPATDAERTTVAAATSYASSTVSTDADPFASPPRAMASPMVTRIRTRMSRDGLVIALARGHRLAFGADAVDLRLAGAFALSAFENDSGEAVFNFNFGNVAAIDASDRHWVWTDAQGRERRMRAFDSAEEGAAGLWQVLARRHAAVLRAFDDRDYPRAVRALERHGYFEADGARYLAAVPRLAESALASLIPARRYEARSKNLALHELEVDVHSSLTALDPMERPLP